jgi:hypothetical protein
MAYRDWLGYAEAAELAEARGEVYDESEYARDAAELFADALETGLGKEDLEAVIDDARKGPDNEYVQRVFEGAESALEQGNDTATRDTVQEGPERGESAATRDGAADGDPSRDETERNKYDELKEKYEDIKDRYLFRNVFVSYAKLELNTEAYKTGRPGADGASVSGGDIAMNVINLMRGNIFESIIEIAVRGVLDERFPAKDTGDVTRDEGLREDMPRIDALPEKEHVYDKDGIVRDDGFVRDTEALKASGTNAEFERNLNPSYGVFKGADMITQTPKERDGMTVWDTGKPSYETAVMGHGTEKLTVPSVRLVEIDKNFYHVGPFGNVISAPTEKANPRSNLVVGDRVGSLDISSYRGNADKFETLASNRGVSTDELKMQLTGKAVENFADGAKSRIEAQVSYLERTAIPEAKDILASYKNDHAVLSKDADNLQSAFDKIVSSGDTNSPELNAIADKFGKVTEARDAAADIIGKTEPRIERMENSLATGRAALAVLGDKGALATEKFEAVVRAEDGAAGRVSNAEYADKATDDKIRDTAAESADRVEKAEKDAASEKSDAVANDTEKDNAGRDEEDKTDRPEKDTTDGEGADKADSREKDSADKSETTAEEKAEKNDTEKQEDDKATNDEGEDKTIAPKKDAADNDEAKDKVADEEKDEAAKDEKDETAKDKDETANEEKDKSADDKEGESKDRAANDVDEEDKSGALEKDAAADETKDEAARDEKDEPAKDEDDKDETANEENDKADTPEKDAADNEENKDKASDDNEDKASKDEDDKDKTANDEKDDTAKAEEDGDRKAETPEGEVSARAKDTAVADETEDKDRPVADEAERDVLSADDAKTANDETAADETGDRDIAAADGTEDAEADKTAADDAENRDGPVADEANDTETERDPIDRDTAEDETEARTDDAESLDTDETPSEKTPIAEDEARENDDTEVSREDETVRDEKRGDAGAAAAEDAQTDDSEYVSAQNRDTEGVSEGKPADGDGEDNKSAYRDEIDDAYDKYLHSDIFSMSEDFFSALPNETILDAEFSEALKEAFADRAINGDEDFDKLGGLLHEIAFFADGGEMKNIEDVANLLREGGMSDLETADFFGNIADGVCAGMSDLISMESTDFLEGAVQLGDDAVYISADGFSDAYTGEIIEPGNVLDMVADFISDNMGTNLGLSADAYFGDLIEAGGQEPLVAEYVALDKFFDALPGIFEATMAETLGVDPADLASAGADPEKALEEKDYLDFLKDNDPMEYANVTGTAYDGELPPTMDGGDYVDISSDDMTPLVDPAYDPSDDIENLGVDFVNDFMDSFGRDVSTDDPDAASM